MAIKPEYDFTKLPKWAQEYIQNIERERDLSIRSLNEFVDNQTPTKFWVEDLVSTGEERGPSNKRHYLQTRDVMIKVGKTEVQILLREENQLDINVGWGTLRFVPLAANSIRIEEPRR